MLHKVGMFVIGLIFLLIVGQYAFIDGKKKEEAAQEEDKVRNPHSAEEMEAMRKHMMENDPSMKPRPELANFKMVELTEEQKMILLDPTHEKNNRQAPATFKAQFRTTAGDFVIEVTREWAPKGADRFYNLVDNGFYNGNRFFRVLDQFVAQFGLNGDPEISKKWYEAKITDEPVIKGNFRGHVTFAMGGKDTRTTQLFINFIDNSQALDYQGFPAFGKVIEGMENVDKIYKLYGQTANQTMIQLKGNSYLTENYPNMDYIIEAKIMTDDNNTENKKEEKINE